MIVVETEKTILSSDAEFTAFLNRVDSMLQTGEATDTESQTADCVRRDSNATVASNTVHVYSVISPYTWNSKQEAEYLDHLFPITTL